MRPIGSSSSWISSSLSLMEERPARHPDGAVLLAPMMGAVMPGFESIQASAICMLGMPRAWATSVTAVGDGEIVILVIQLVGIIVGLGP